MARLLTFDFLSVGSKVMTIKKMFLEIGKSYEPFFFLSDLFFIMPETLQKCNFRQFFWLKWPVLA
jgi:hypothetical protein